jgi:hypothetical protein
VKVADTVTSLFGMVNVHGFDEDPPEQDAPVTVQLENVQPEVAVAETETDDPTCCWQPLGQLGETEPLSEAAFVVKVGMFCVKVAVNVT